MYQLTLNQSERKAIDWVGERYSTGNDLYKVLWACENTAEESWDEKNDITFFTPENKAWEIMDIINEATNNLETSIPCYGDDFRCKLMTLYNSIV